MIQIRVGGVTLDLYEFEPINMIFNIEDISTLEPKSEFTRVFRIPATPTNNNIFQYAYDLQQWNWDATKEVKCDILIDGNEFKRGVLFLNKVIKNNLKDIIEYEVNFLGSTSNFKKELKNKTLNDLDYSSLEHTLNYDNVVLSWGAYPSGTTTDGLLGGDIYYPLIDYGNEYFEELPLLTRISQNNTGSHFTQNSHPLTTERFKPMVRLEKLFDIIFSSTTYTLDSTFLRSNEVKNLYVSAFGNEKSNITLSSNNLLQVNLTTNILNQTSTLVVKFNNEVIDPANNYSTSTGQYVVPLNGSYDIQAVVYGSVRALVPSGGGTLLLELVKDTGGVETILDSSSYFVDGVNGFDYLDFTFNTGLLVQTLTANDKLFVRATPSGSIDRFDIYSLSSLNITRAPGDINIQPYMDNRYIVTDFVKDIITKFRMVFVPNEDGTEARKITIEPWKDYIGSGKVIDWSDRVVLEKDITIEPPFIGRGAKITFSDTEDTDFLNDINNKEFKEVFGTARVIFNYDSLSGEEEVSTNLSPTPFTQIERKDFNIGTTFFIPQIHFHEFQDNNTFPKRHEVMRPNTRLLYYNGMYDTDSITWYFENDDFTTYPLTTFYSAFPPSADTTNLNWQVEKGYDQHEIFDPYLSSSVYDTYWIPYLSNIYDKNARRVKLTLILDGNDLLDFEYKDVIFISGEYFYVENIEVQDITKKSECKVSLIRLLDYQVNTDNFTPPEIFNIWNLVTDDWGTTLDSWND